MVTEEQVNRINELARKSKTPEGLTEEEKEEQKVLRRLFIDSFKENLRAELNNIEIVDQKQAEEAFRVYGAPLAKPLEKPHFGKLFCC